MNAGAMAEVIEDVERDGRGRRTRLQQMGIPRSTYYWWRKHRAPRQGGRQPSAGRAVEPAAAGGGGPNLGGGS